MYKAKLDRLTFSFETIQSLSEVFPGLTLSGTASIGAESSEVLRLIHDVYEPLFEGLRWSMSILFIPQYIAPKHTLDSTSDISCACSSSNLFRFDWM